MKIKFSKLQDDNKEINKLKAEGLLKTEKILKKCSIIQSFCTSRKSFVLSSKISTITIHWKTILE